jgi:RHS repeat-associated protein
VDVPGDVLQENHFYAFGMEMNYNWLNNSGLTDDAYKYNGKEMNGDYGLNWSDYGARWYDGAVGRWWSVDPLGEKYLAYSGFNYTLNNPLRYIDPDGAQVGVDTVAGGGANGRDLINITVTGKIINLSNKSLDMADILAYLKTEVESIYEGQDVEGYDYKSKPPTNPIWRPS